CSALSVSLHAEDHFARLLYTTTNDAVGPLRSGATAEVRIFDLRTWQEKTFSADKVLKLEKDLSDEQAAKYVGIPPIIAYRILERSAGANKSGQAVAKIAQITPTAIYVTMGSERGIRVGQTLGVFRSGEEIKDPD